VYASCIASSFPMLTIVEADPGATMTFVAGGALKPIGGHILSHASATRMFLRKGTLPSCSASGTSTDYLFSQAVQRSASRSWWTAPIGPSRRRLTSWTRAAGPMSEPLLIAVQARTH
jgi:hypothetical protein